MRLISIISQTLFKDVGSLSLLTAWQITARANSTSDKVDIPVDSTSGFSVLAMPTTGRFVISPEGILKKAYLTVQGIQFQLSCKCTRQKIYSFLAA